MIEIIYGIYDKKENELLVKEKTAGFYSYLKLTTKTYILDNILIPLDKDEIEWICINAKANVKIVLKDKRMRFTKTNTNKFTKLQKHKQKVIITDNTKKENIFKYLNDIVYNYDRDAVYKKLKDNKVPLMPLVNQLLLFIDYFKGQEEVFQLLDKMLYKSDKAMAEILCYNLKPIRKRINFWNRKNES